MGTKKRVHKKPKKTNKRQKYRGGDQDNCEGYRVNSDGTKRCHRCRKGYLPNLEGICKVEKGNAIELREKGVLPNCDRCITSDNDYSYEGYVKNPEKKYDCTLCKNSLFDKNGMFVPLGPPGNRRCEPMYVPVDLENKDHCKMVENNSCTVCDVGYVPAGPFGKKRCIRAGQMWNGVIVGEETVAPMKESEPMKEPEPQPQIDREKREREQREREFQQRKQQLDQQQDQMEQEQRTQELQRIAPQPPQPRQMLPRRPVIQALRTTAPVQPQLQQQKKLQRQILLQQRQMIMMKRKRERELRELARTRNRMRNRRFGGTKKRK